jgi:hypothetical protein
MLGHKLAALREQKLDIVEWKEPKRLLTLSSSNILEVDEVMYPVRLTMEFRMYDRVRWRLVSICGAFFWLRIRRVVSCGAMNKYT